MNGRFALDTNILIALFGGDESVVGRFAESDELFVPSIVLGELYYGAYNSARVRQNVARIETLKRATTVLGCDGATAAQYGQTRQRLRRKGKPLPENDIWIAAVALQHELTLVTRDAHFTAVEGLSLEVW